MGSSGWILGTDSPINWEDRQTGGQASPLAKCDGSKTGRRGHPQRDEAKTKPTYRGRRGRSRHKPGARSRQYLVLRTFAELLIRLTVQSKGCRASEPGKLLRSNAQGLAVDGGSIGHTADDTRELQGPWLPL